MYQAESSTDFLCIRKIRIMDYISKHTKTRSIIDIERNYNDNRSGNIKCEIISDPKTYREHKKNLYNMLTHYGNHYYPFAPKNDNLNSIFFKNILYRFNLNDINGLISNNERTISTKQKNAYLENIRVYDLFYPLLLGCLLNNTKLLKNGLGKAEELEDYKTKSLDMAIEYINYNQEYENYFSDLFSDLGSDASEAAIRQIYREELDLFFPQGLFNIVVYVNNYDYGLASYTYRELINMLLSSHFYVSIYQDWFFSLLLIELNSRNKYSKIIDTKIYPEIDCEEKEISINNYCYNLYLIAKQRESDNLHHVYKKTKTTNPTDTTHLDNILYHVYGYT